MSLKFSNPEQFIIGYSTSRYKGYETNDCVVKAFAILFGISYDESHGFARGFFQRNERNGTRGLTQGIRTMMKHPHARFNGNITEMECRKNETVSSIQKRHAKGIFLVDTFDHVSVLCDGVWLDYKGLITSSSKVNAVYQFSDFEHYATIRSQLGQDKKKEIDWLTLILLALIAYAVFFEGDKLKRDLNRLKHWVTTELF
jgi:hypothetical protein